MAGVKLKCCILYMALPLLGIMVLMYGVINTGVMKNADLKTTSRRLADKLPWRRQEDVMLLRPVVDESRIPRFDPAEVVQSQMGSNIPELNQGRKTLLTKLSNLEGSLENTTVSLLDSKRPDVLRQVHVRNFARPSPQEFDNIIASEDLEGQYLQAVKPKLEAFKTSEHTRIHIVIVTNRRSGSSFLGEFFNQHPSVFFQFEPLKLTEWKREIYPDQTDCLHHLVKCEFDKTPYLVEFLSRVDPVHRANSKVMVSPPFCNLSFYETASSIMTRKCEPLQTIPLIKACETRQYIAAKLIRLVSLSSLKPLAFDPAINLKIIHLVRDPRGTYISRTKARNAKDSLNLGKTFDYVVGHLCERIHNNLDFVRSQPAWLQGKYKLVRYEDVAQNPQKLAEEIYRFAGMGNLPKEVVKWIDTNTKAIGKRWAKDYYSTSRNASQVWEAWRYNVSLAPVLHMQDICKTTLKELGYGEVKTEQELLDKSKSLVNTFPGLPQ